MAAQTDIRVLPGDAPFGTPCRDAKSYSGSLVTPRGGHFEGALLPDFGMPSSRDFLSLLQNCGQVYCESWSGSGARAGVAFRGIPGAPFLVSGALGHLLDA